MVKGTSARITATGMSMYPFLRENIDSVELSKVRFSDIRRGDILMLLRDSNEYIFEEATSTLDSITEMNILKAIRNLSPVRTCVIITHRACTLSICHRILRLEDGNIFETNNYIEAAVVYRKPTRKINKIINK